MTQYSTEPEFSVEEKSEKTYQQLDLSGLSDPKYNLDALVAELAQLSMQVDLVTDISKKIRDSLHVLVLSLEEH